MKINVKKFMMVAAWLIPCMNAGVSDVSVTGETQDPEAVDGFLANATALKDAAASKKVPKVYLCLRQNLKDYIKKSPEEIEAYLKELREKEKQDRTMFQKAKQELAESAAKLHDMLAKKSELVVSKTRELVDEGVKGVREGFDRAGKLANEAQQRLVEAVRSAPEKTKAAVEAGVKEVKAGLERAGAFARDVERKLEEAVKQSPEKAKEVAAQVKRAAEETVAKLEQGAKALAEKTKASAAKTQEAVEAGVEALKKDLHQATEAVKQASHHMAAAVQETVHEAKVKAEAFFENGAKTIREKTAQFGQALKGFGRRISVLGSRKLKPEEAQEE